MVYASRMAWSREYNDEKRGAELSMTAASAFDYRFRDVLEGSHVDILHTSDLIIPHGYYGCGDFPSDDMFRLGCYHIFYKDGTDERVDILWVKTSVPLRRKRTIRPMPLRRTAAPPTSDIAVRPSSPATLLTATTVDTIAL